MTRSMPGWTGCIRLWRGKLGAHSALGDLAEEAATEQGVSELTRQQVELAVTAAARKDEEFGQAVTELVGRLQAAEQAAGVSVLAGARVSTGDAHAQASRGGMAFGPVAGDVSVHGAAGSGAGPMGPPVDPRASVTTAPPLAPTPPPRSSPQLKPLQPGGDLPAALAAVNSTIPVRRSPGATPASMGYGLDPCIAGRIQRRGLDLAPRLRQSRVLAGHDCDDLVWMSGVVA